MHSPWYDAYWPQWVVQNIVPTYVCLIAGVVLGYFFRARLTTWWRGLVGDRADLDDIRRAATAAHQIAADLYEHHTGHAHPCAPAKTSDEGGVL